MKPDTLLKDKKTGRVGKFREFCNSGTGAALVLVEGEKYPVWFEDYEVVDKP